MNFIFMPDVKLKYAVTANTGFVDPKTLEVQKEGLLNLQNPLISCEICARFMPYARQGVFNKFCFFN